MTKGPVAFVALGANLCRPVRQLREALAALARRPGLRVTGASSIYRTAPVGPVPQEPFLNAVVSLAASVPPEELIGALLDIEHAMGRERSMRWGPRLIDLDLLLYGDRVIDVPGLRVPHPRMHERRFVLAPLAELAPEAYHPVLGRSADQLLAALGEDGPWAERTGEGWGDAAAFIEASTSP